MHRIALILLAVFVSTMALSVSNLMMKEGLTVADSVKVVLCSYSRVIGALLSGRLNVHSGLMTTQCMSDML